MLRNESVKVYELPTGFTLEATVSSSDSEITQLTSASFSVSAVVYYRFKRLIVDIADMSSNGPGFAYQHV